jgi:hypothetical protein
MNADITCFNPVARSTPFATLRTYTVGVMAVDVSTPSPGPPRSQPGFAKISFKTCKNCFNPVARSTPFATHPLWVYLAIVLHGYIFR